jgi:hypothetical protein
VFPSSECDLVVRYDVIVIVVAVVVVVIVVIVLAPVFPRSSGY